MDVDQLKSNIRAAALKRHPNLDTHESIRFGSLPQIKQTNHQRRLTLSPEFTVRGDNTYHVNDLLKYHDRDFVKNSYRAILKARTGRGRISTQFGAAPERHFQQDRHSQEPALFG